MRPEASEPHHGRVMVGGAALLPARMSCPRGDSLVTYMPACIGELVLVSSQ
jgi:hypothetical protein